MSGLGKQALGTKALFIPIVSHLVQSRMPSIFFAPYRDNSKSILPSQDYLVCLGGSKANGHVMFLRRHFAKFSLWFFRGSS